MLTRNAKHLRRAIACYDAQTYQNRELIVVHAHEDPELGPILAQRPDVKCVEANPATNIGTRRNLSLKHASGEWFAIWDDDDWHAPRRLELQLAAAVKQEKLACVLDQELIFDEVDEQAFYTTRRLWEHSLVCKCKLPRQEIRWGGSAPRGEDTPVIDLLARHNWLEKMTAPELYIYTYHGYNVWGHEHHQQLRGSAPMPTMESTRIGHLLDHDREMRRASGDVACRVCRKPYRSHPLDPMVMGYDGPFLNLLCDGDRVKL